MSSIPKAKAGSNPALTTKKYICNIVNSKNNKSMENQEVLKITWKKGVKEVKPVHQMVQNWMFTEETEELATLAHHMAVVAEKNGLSVNDLQHLFPAVLRMLKDTSNWSK